MGKNQTRASRKKQKSVSKKPILKKIIFAILIFFIAMGLGVGGVFGYFILTAPKIDFEKLDVPYSSQFYDKEGKVFADVGTENRIKIQYDQLPDILIEAVIATEDARFFEHPGVDVRRLFGAVKANIERGFGAEGASTITQQVVENMFLTPEKTIKLKVQEQWLALKLEREYSKEQILEIYLNKIFYGSNAYGVGKAAEVYFGIKDLNDLSLIQAAMLAGLPQRPTAYNPFENPDLMQGRVDTVLTLMVRHGKITQAEADEARNIDVATVLTDKKPRSLPYEAFRQQVINELENKLPNIDFLSAGLEIHTTLDQSAQKHVEFLLTDSNDNPIPYPDEDLQAGMAVVDTKTGAIRAIGGSRNRENVMGDNYAIKLDRQPGSTIKPILSYGPAIEYEKWSTYHQINDDKPFETGSGHQIRNWNRQYQGWLSARTALKDSLNVPAVKTFMEIGPDRAKKFAENLGIEFADEHLSPQDAIGGTATTTTPLKLAGAFSAFGNEGIFTEPYAVTKVIFPDGSELELKPESEAVMADYTAYMVTDMLKDVLRSGTGRNANISNLPVAGKTGTTNVQGKSGANNSWFVGYTTNYSIGIWTGYSEEYTRIIQNTQIPHALFTNTMNELSKEIDTPDFVKPNSVVEVPVEKGSNPPSLPSEFTPKENIVTELFVKGTEPTQISEKFDQLEPVSNLNAHYNEDSDSIDITWDYESESEVKFELAYKLDQADFRTLTSTTERVATINQIERGATYTIQVIVVNEENNTKSEPKSVTVNVPDKEEESLPPVSNLNAKFNEQTGSVIVNWSYSGPPAQYEVDINGQGARTIQSTSLEITDVTPGSTYSISVTPVSGEKRGEPRNTTITIEQSPGNNIGDNDNDDSDEDQVEE